MKIREYMILGACLASPKLLDQIESRSFLDERVRGIIGQLKSKRNAPDSPVDLLTHMLDQTAPSTTGNSIERLMQAQRVSGFRQQVNALGLQLTNGCETLTVQQLQEMLRELERIPDPEPSV